MSISVFGPPSTSGTYDAFKELILGKGCDANAEMKALKDSTAKTSAKKAVTIHFMGFFLVYLE